MKGSLCVFEIKKGTEAEGERSRCCFYWRGFRWVLAWGFTEAARIDRRSVREIPSHALSHTHSASGLWSPMKADGSSRRNSPVRLNFFLRGQSQEKRKSSFV